MTSEVEIEEEREAAEETVAEEVEEEEKDLQENKLRVIMRKVPNKPQLRPPMLLNSEETAPKVRLL